MSTALPYVPSVGKADDTPVVPVVPSVVNGVTITAAELAEETGIAEDRATRLLLVAAQMCVDYAADAPTPLLNEAVLRLVAYLGDAAPGTVRSSSLGPQSVDLTVNHASAFRNSGAAMLLTRYVERRAGTFG